MDTIRAYEKARYDTERQRGIQTDDMAVTLKEKASEIEQAEIDKRSAYEKNNRRCVRRFSWWSVKF